MREQAAAPLIEYWPPLHWLGHELVLPIELLKHPAVTFKQDTALFALYFPLGHKVQDDTPASTEDTEYWPGMQAVQVDEPLAEYVPDGHTLEHADVAPVNPIQPTNI